MAGKKKDSPVTVQVTTEPAFEKEQLVRCARYSRKSDLVASLLKDGEKYTFAQVDKLIDQFLGTDFTERKGE